MSEPVPTAQLENESAKAYQAFTDYLDMGIGRSVEKLAQKYLRYGPEQGEPPTRSKNTLKSWQKKHSWENRVAKEKERIVLETREKKQLEREQQVIGEIQKFRKAQESLGNGMVATAATLMKLCKYYAEEAHSEANMAQRAGQEKDYAAKQVHHRNSLACIAAINKIAKVVPPMVETGSRRWGESIGIYRMLGQLDGEGA